MRSDTRFPDTHRFEPRAEVGEGGFGIVWKAYDRERHELVALKVLKHAEGMALLRFKREFRSLADVSHRNLVSLYELLTDGQLWFFTMQLVEGKPILDHLLDGRAPGTQLDERRLLKTIPQLVDAVSAVHHIGLVHRDIKPSNVLVTDDERVVLLDFGLALERDLYTDDESAFESYLSTSGTVIGTPAYMAPEQADGAGTAPATDWYSVGVILYQALTGRLPFEGEPEDQIEAKRCLRPAAPHDIALHIPRELSDLCMGLLAPDPNDRAVAIMRLQALGRPAFVTDTAPALGGPELLVGRDGHLAELSRAFHTAMDGTPLVVTVSGVSGIGKSALVRRFLSDIRKSEPDLVVFASRCYERETSPYKAVGAIVDAVAHHLRMLRDIEVARLLPRDAALLARLFPTLQAVDEIRRSPEHVTTALDSIAVRRRAAEALKDLLFEIAVRAPVVIWIDDAQWGDADSAAVLDQVLRDSDAPPLLAVVSYRSEGAEGTPLVALFKDMRTRQDSVATRDMSVGPLSEADCLALASQIGSDTATTSTVVRESGGNPFFIHELARHTIDGGGAPRLKDIVSTRLHALPPTVQRMMVAVSLSVQAVPPSVAALAAGFESGVQEAERLLTVGRMIRVAGQGDTRTIEPYHDRIREMIVALHPADESVAVHRALARAWESSPAARPETLTAHFRAAGDIGRAVHYGEQAAERAARALAFDRAAEHYTFLVHEAPGHDMHTQWLVRLGDALVNCGRGFEAASAYLRALKTMPEPDIELERRAVSELIRAGYLDESTQALNTLLPKVGVSPLGGSMRSLATLITYRTLLAVRGLSVTPCNEADAPRIALQRVDVLQSIAPPLTLISLPRGLAMNLKAVWHSVRLGERERAAVGLALYASTITMSGTKTYRRALRYVEQAKQLAEPLDDPWTTGRTELAEGICYKVSGFWTRGIQALERGIEIFTRCPGAWWEIQTSNTLRHDAMIWTGDWRRLTAELPIRRSEAQQRGDRYSESQVAGRLSPLMRLAEHRVDDAKRESDDARRFYVNPQFNLQHRAALCSLLDIDLYDERPADAHARLCREWPVLTGTLAMFQNGRIEAQYYRARIALTLAARGDAQALKRVRDSVRRLDKEHAGYATALASLARAAIAYSEKHADDTRVWLTQAMTGFTECDMRLYAAAAALRLGMVVGGDEGRALIESGRRAMSEEGIVRPERIANLLAPGEWQQ